jgi:hypothetical protein
VHVDEAQLVEHLREPGALLGQEARVLLVGAPVLEIDLLVRDVHVAAQHHLAAAGAQLGKVRQEARHEAELRGLPVRAGRARRYIQRDHGELAELRLQVAALVIELRHAEAAARALGPLLGIQRRAGIALLLCAVKVRMQAVRIAQGLGDVVLVRLDLLQAQHVRIDPSHPAPQPLAGGRANAIDVERGDADHGVVLRGLKARTG